MYLGVLAAGFAREYFRRYEARNQEAARLQAEAAALRAQLAEAQLAALRMQLNPHFLFNTLHAISALVDRDPAGVRRMIARLSELLRSTLEDGAQPERTLEQELAFLSRYLEIMQVRFQGKLDVGRSTSIPRRARRAGADADPPAPGRERGQARRGERAGRRTDRGARRGAKADRVVLSVRDNGPGPLRGAGRRARAASACATRRRGCARCTARRTPCRCAPRKAAERWRRSGSRTARAARGRAPPAAAARP